MLSYTVGPTQKYLWVNQNSKTHGPPPHVHHINSQLVNSIVYVWASTFSQLEASTCENNGEEDGQPYQPREVDIRY